MSNLSLKVSRDWGKILFFTRIPWTDCTTQLNFVILELQSPTRSGKTQVTTADGYIVGQGLGQSKSK